MARPTWYNWSLGVGFFILCGMLAHEAGANVTAMGPTFRDLGIATTLIIAGRAANKWAEAKNGANVPRGTPEGS